MENGLQKRRDWMPLIGCVLILLIFLFIHDLGRVSILESSAWDSYSLQARRWREGHLDLGQDYPWLEIAEYQGKYFLSFPPVPTVPMFFLSYFFPEVTPTNLVMKFYLMASFLILYKLFRKRGSTDYFSLFWALFLTLGCNLASVSVYGGVWFQAQSLCFVLLSASLYAMMVSRNAWLAYSFLALAVGCRPFVIVFYPALMAYFWMVERRKLPEAIPWKRLLLPLIPSAIIGGIYMWYNWARFDHVLEFGHNYLPEFVEAELGQFHPAYVGENFYRLLLRGVGLSPEGFLEYEIFDGFLFWLVNPFYIVYLITWAQAWLRGKNKILLGTLALCVALHLLALMFHKTLGGWQFGARYTIDGIPYLALPLLLLKQRRPPAWMIGVGIFGIAFNLYGAVAYLVLL